MPSLVLGTHNAKKRSELEALLAPLGLVLKTLADFENPLSVVEDGDSFEANARLKAGQQALHLNEWVLGEDSGLVVDALGGRPGIHSARYAGLNATDEQNNRRLLDELGERSASQRAAHYTCHMSLADPSGEIRAESVGSCHGQIVQAPRGSGGFGYDPLFALVEYHRTFGELLAAVKAVISHRARAARGLARKLPALIEAGGWR